MPRAHKIPPVITRKNAEPLLRAIRKEPCMQPGPTKPCPSDAWFYQDVVLEVPLGELARGGLQTMALVGRARQEGRMETVALTGKEGFNAQGLEGKVRIRKPLLHALFNLDLVPEHRGRIVRR